MEMLYEWWGWICHSLCHTMMMTYKIKDSSLSHLLRTWAGLQVRCARARATLNRSCASDLITHRAADPPLWAAAQHVGRNPATHLPLTGPHQTDEAAGAISLRRRIFVRSGETADAGSVCLPWEGKSCPVVPSIARAITVKKTNKPKKCYQLKIYSPTYCAPTFMHIFLNS